MAAELRFRAMGSDCHVIVVGGRPGLAEEARRRVDDLERRWSRFLPDSEVSALNRLAGQAVEVSPDTLELVRRAIDAWWLSAGLFDPTLLGPLVRAGYDRTFEELQPDTTPPSPFTTGVAGITIDGRSVRLPAGVGFDPGGIGKGLAADLVTEELLGAGAQGACVNLGGDVRVAGAGPDGEAWTIAVEHEWRVEPLAHLGLAGGAVATSTTLRRRWSGRDGDAKHHLIDPHSGLPSTTDVNHATVIAACVWVAEVLAKAVLLKGTEHPFDILGGTGAEALIVDHAGAVRHTPGLLAYLGGAGLPAAISVSTPAR